MPATSTPQSRGPARAAPPAELIRLYRAMFSAREIDAVEAHYLNRGEAAFAVAGAGHEVVAALADLLIPEDYLHLHYRDKALMLARGMLPRTFFLAAFCKAASPSNGRQMSAHLAERRLNILSPTGPVGNHALQAVGVAAEVKGRAERPLVVCTMGDGTSQQGEVLEAIAEAVREQLPVLFIIEDNGLAISTRTGGRTFFHLPSGLADSFYGLPIHRLDGRDVPDCQERFREIVAAMRENRGPAIVHVALERLASHTNADDESLYRSPAELNQVHAGGDPIVRLRRHLSASGVDVSAIEVEARAEISRAASNALNDMEPQPVLQAARPLPAPRPEHRGNGEGDRLTMLAAIRGVLHERLRQDARVSLYGEDIEDPKGDVFGLTRGLSTAFPGRVVNSPLSESTIVGNAIGRALAGGRPVAFLQFADFLPLAFNQVAAELATMYWRTAGEWECPVIVMIASGAYRPGLGPFHAQSMESLAAHLPGVDVFMPATAGDAAGLLNAAFESGRPTLFFYPKNCLNEWGPESTTSPDLSAHWVPPGKARLVREGDDITLVAWGNTVGICSQVADTLTNAGYTADLLDLRTLSPWDEAAVLASVERTGRVLVVHEDNRTCGFGAEVLATVLEKVNRPVAARRAVRADTHLPCHFGNQQAVLPSFRTVLTEAGHLLGWDVEWRRDAAPGPGTFMLKAVGTAPSDRSVLLSDWQVHAGDTVREGQTLVCLEGSKSIFELASPVSGLVEALLASAGEEVAVGTPIARIGLAGGGRQPAPAQHWTPVIRGHRTAAPPSRCAPALSKSETNQAGITAVATALGSLTVGNADLLREHWQQSEADIARKTGILTRRRADTGEDVVTLGALAVRKALTEAHLALSDIGLVICSTATPDLLSPSVACRILERLGATTQGRAAYDVNAACAGYLYGLKAARDHLQGEPDGHVLLITAEVISPLLDSDDFGTAILFGDAATATVISGHAHHEKWRLLVETPSLGASPESGKYLRVPHADSPEALLMDGMKVFEMGVRCMTGVLRKACAEASIDPQSLDLLVPHQANQRIVDTICGQLRLPRERLYSNLSRMGNTSSSSIPICLSELLDGELKARTLGLTAFGAGFTYGACILRNLQSQPREIT